MGVGAEEALLVIVERVVGTALMLIVGSVLEVTFLLTVENVVGFALARSPLCTVTEPAARARGKRVTRVSAAVCILATGVEVVWSLVVVLSETMRSREGAVWFYHMRLIALRNDCETSTLAMLLEVCRCTVEDVVGGLDYIVAGARSGWFARAWDGLGMCRVKGK